MFGFIRAMFCRDVKLQGPPPVVQIPYHGSPRFVAYNTRHRPNNHWNVHDTHHGTVCAFFGTRDVGGVTARRRAEHYADLMNRETTHG